MNRIRKTGIALMEKARIQLYVAVTTVLTHPAFAQIQQPQLPDGSAASDNIFADIAKVVQAGGKLLIYALLVGGYIIAGYMIIVGAYKVLTSKEGGLAQFSLGVLIAIIMVIIMTYFLAEGETALDSLSF